MDTREMSVGELSAVFATLSVVLAFLVLLWALWATRTERKLAAQMRNIDLSDPTRLLSLLRTEGPGALLPAAWKYAAYHFIARTSTTARFREAATDGVLDHLTLKGVPHMEALFIERWVKISVDELKSAMDCKDFESIERVCRTSADVSKVPLLLDAFKHLLATAGDYSECLTVADLALGQRGDDFEELRTSAIDKAIDFASGEERDELLKSYIENVMGHECLWDHFLRTEESVQRIGLIIADNSVDSYPSKKAVDRLQEITTPLPF